MSSCKAGSANESPKRTRLARTSLQILVAFLAERPGTTIRFISLLELELELFPLEKQAFFLLLLLRSEEQS